MGRIVAWDELSLFVVWDELSLGTNRRLGRIVALRLGSLNVFTNRKLAKKCRGVPSDRIRKFPKKSHIVPKKTQKSSLYFWKHKKICGLVRESNPQSPASQKDS